MPVDHAAALEAANRLIRSSKIGPRAKDDHLVASAYIDREHAIQEAIATIEAYRRDENLRLSISTADGALRILRERLGLFA